MFHNEKEFYLVSCSSGCIPLTFYLSLYQYNVRMKGQQEVRDPGWRQQYNTVARKTLEAEQQQNNRTTEQQQNNNRTTTEQQQ